MEANAHLVHGLLFLCLLVFVLTRRRGRHNARRLRRQGGAAAFCMYAIWV